MNYKLDNKDMQLLFELDKNARIAETNLAKIIGKSKESVRYRLKKMQEEKIIIGFTTWIDPVRMGYQTGKIYLNLANIPNKKKQFIDYIKKDKRLFWLGIAEGVWNAGLTFFVRDDKEFFDIKNNLFFKFKDLILESKTASVVGIYYHDKTFLHKDKTIWNSMLEKKDNIELDDIGKKVLKSLFKNSRENIATIAHDYKTTVDIVRNRMKNMEENSIIKKYTLLIDYKKIGYELYKTFIYFKSLDTEEFDRFMKYAQNQSNIIHIVKQISPWDLELEIMCNGFNEYNKIISELTENFSNSIQKVETAIMYEDRIFPSEKLIFE